MQNVRNFVNLMFPTSKSKVSVELYVKKKKKLKKGPRNGVAFAFSVQASAGDFW